MGEALTALRLPKGWRERDGEVDGDRLPGESCGLVAPTHYGVADGNLGLWTSRFGGSRDERVDTGDLTRSANDGFENEAAFDAR